MASKPTRNEEWRARVAGLFCKLKTHEERRAMESQDLFLFWGEHRAQIGPPPKSEDPWQAFHSACSNHYGPLARHF